MSTGHGGQICRIHLADAGSSSSSSEDISSRYHLHDQAMDATACDCDCACACALCNCSVSDGQEFATYKQATDGRSIQRQHEQQAMAASPPESEASTPPREFSGASSPTLGSSFLLSLTNVPTWSSQAFLFGQAMLTPPSMADHDEAFHMEQQNNSDDEFPSIVPLANYEDIDMEQSPDHQGSADDDGVAVTQSGFLESDASFADYPSSESGGTHSSSSDTDDDSVMSDLRDIEPEFDGFGGDDDYSSIFGSDGSETVVNEVTHSSDPPTAQGVPPATDYADASDDDDTIDFGEAGSHNSWNQWSMPPPLPLPPPAVDASDPLVSLPISAPIEFTVVVGESLVSQEAPPEPAAAAIAAAAAFTALDGVIDATDQSPTEQHELAVGYSETELVPANMFLIELSGGGKIFAHIDEFGNANLPHGYRKDFESNMDYPTFMRQWCIRTLMLKGTAEGPGQAALRVYDWKRDPEITADQVNGEEYDIQGINWKALGVSRAEARKARKEYYKNYTNLKNDRLLLDVSPVIFFFLLLFSPQSSEDWKLSYGKIRASCILIVGGGDDCAR
jgi:hypothetical protein